jgi:hypothetical protein
MPQRFMSFTASGRKDYKRGGFSPRAPKDEAGVAGFRYGMFGRSDPPDVQRLARGEQSRKVPGWSGSKRIDGGQNQAQQNDGGAGRQDRGWGHAGEWHLDGGDHKMLVLWGSARPMTFTLSSRGAWVFHRQGGGVPFRRSRVA